MNLSCIPSELVEVVSLCILYSHIYSGLLISFVERRSIDRTTLNLCVFWYISRCLLTRGLSRFALLASVFTPAYFRS